MEHSDHVYLSTQVIQIPSKSKTSFSILKISRAFHSGALRLSGQKRDIVREDAVLYEKG